MRVCKKDKCGRRHYGRGLCRLHYDQEVRHRKVRELDRGPVPTTPGEVSWCPGCKRFLAVDNFHKSSRRSSGLAVWCKECKSERGKTQYRNKVSTPEGSKAFKDRGRKRREHLRRSALQAYGGKCACCGEDWDPYLELDHIDGGGSEHRSLVGSVWQDLKSRGYPPGFQVLCSNCHSAKTRRAECRHELLES
jgi:hypothetical protein